MQVAQPTRLLTAVFCAITAVAQAPPSANRGFPLPDAPDVSLSRHEKLHNFVRQTYSPYSFVSAAFDAAYAQMTGDPYEYGGGVQGYGKRFGAAIANTEASRFFNRFLFPSIFHQDPRYFRAVPNSGIVRRAWYAATRVLLTRGDSGQQQFNYSEVLGTACTATLENAYYPERARAFGPTVSRFTGALLSDAGSNLAREFWPDMRRAFRRHEPKSMQKIQHEIEQKVPPSIRGVVNPFDDK